MEHVLPALPYALNALVPSILITGSNGRIGMVLMQRLGECSAMSWGFATATRRAFPACVNTMGRTFALMQ